MQKSITKLLILTIILTAALGVNYLFAAWTGPTQAPPEGNTPTPINVGATNQVKDGGLSLDALSVFGGGYFQGNVGIGVVTPTEALDVSGGAKISEGLQVGNTTNTNAGTIRWTGIDLEVYNGSSWTSLTSGEVAPAEDPNYINCINAGGNWIDAQGVCYFSGTSCPAGWTQKQSYSSTNSITCGSSCGTSCTTGTHYRENIAPETCIYKEGQTLWSGGRGGSYKCAQEYLWSSRTCSASTIAEVGCTKN